MKKYLVTDPCYIINHDDWHALCDQATKAEKEQGRNWSNEFVELVETSLRTISGDISAVACNTGYGDWENCMFGSVVKHSQFVADAGMVCVVEFTDKLAEYLKDTVDNVDDLSAILESESPLHAEFNTDDAHWTVVEVFDEDGRLVANSLYPDTEEDEEE